jgi:inositol hexakisphosphate/diphosphoinositol-pentakisphosphate kinase
MYCVLSVSRYGHFSGINRKIQFKYLGKVRDSSESSGGEEKQSKVPVAGDSETEKTPKAKEKESREEEALLLIMKWGGELTQAGRVQAEELGKAFRSVITIWR